MPQLAHTSLSATVSSSALLLITIIYLCYSYQYIVTKSYNNNPTTVELITFYAFFLLISQDFWFVLFVGRCKIVGPSPPLTATNKQQQ
jgi:hypothetical protein